MSLILPQVERERKSDLGMEGRVTLPRRINGEQHPRQPEEHVRDARGARTLVEGGTHMLRCHHPQWTGLKKSVKSRLARVELYILW